jgi:hypothetical protein
MTLIIIRGSHNGEIKKLTGPALAEIKASFRPRFEEAVRVAAQKLQEAAAAVENVLAIRREAAAAGDEISWLPVSMTPPITPLLIACAGRAEYGPLNRWLRAVAAEGIDLA